MAVDSNRISTFTKSTLIVIISWSLLLPIYFGNVNLVTPVAAQSLEENIFSLFSRGNEALQQGMYDQAIEYYDRVLALDPNHVMALYNKGSILDDLGRYQEAIEYYDTALAIDPNHINALNGKGVALVNLGRHQEAIEYFDRVLAIDPNDTDALNNKGLALAALQESVRPAQ